MDFGIDGYLDFKTRPAGSPGLPPVGKTRLYFDGASGKLKVSQDGGAWANVVPEGTTVDWVDITNKPSTFAPSTHTHPQADVTSLVSDLAGKAASSHTHPQSDVTSLVADLAARELIANKGAASGYAALDSGTKVPTAQLGGAGADSTKFLRGDQTWAAAGGSGADPPEGSYAPGSYTVATGKFRDAGKRQQFTSTQRLTLQGTARLSVHN